MVFKIIEWGIVNWGDNEVWEGGWEENFGLSIFRGWVYGGGGSEEVEKE